MRRVWWVLLAVAVVGTGTFLFFRSKNAKPEVQFVTAPVSQGDIVQRVTATGTLSATVTVTVGAQVSGRIAELNVDFNSPVKKGQVLAKIDPDLFTTALNQAKANERAANANVTKAKATAADAQRQLTRSQELFAQKLVAQADLDTAQANADIAAAGVEAAEAASAQARAMREQAQVNLQYTTIISPIDGVVISRAIEVGQTVASSLQTPTLFTIAEDLRRMKIDTAVAEADVGKLKEGAAVTFTVDAFPQQKFAGTVRQIRNAATVTSNVVTYDAVIDVENPDLVLRPSMTANVTFVVQQADDVLRVPNAALRFKMEPVGKLDGVPPPPKGSRLVTVLRDGRPERVAVVTGLTDGSFTEVVSGLSAGDLVVTDRSGAAGAGGQRRSSGGAGGPPPRMF